MTKRPLTAKAALAEARRRWGEKAAVQESRSMGRRLVGVVRFSALFEVLGVGDTWEEAFEDADGRAARIERVSHGQNDPHERA